MNRPLLSICIPTYNRADCLKACLDSIVDQFNDREVFDNVEIVISDNASSDNTTDIVDGFRKKYSNIRYSKNKTNIGFDRNLLTVVATSTGKYCLTIGDDDAIFPNTLSILLGKIVDLNVPYLMLNCWGYDNRLLSPVNSRPNLKIDRDKIYESLASFVESIDNPRDQIGLFGGMSTQVFLREDWMNFQNKDNYIGTQTIHLHILLSVFKDKRFAMIAEPMIKTRNDNMRWNTYPGLETSLGRSRSTIKGILWIDNLYGLHHSQLKIRTYFIFRGYWFFIKNMVKAILSRLGLY
jgi:abequosyltransferase